jgi:hypothetical protein
MQMRKNVLFYLFLFCSFIHVYGQNYDETKVPLYTLPALLTTSDHHPITSAAGWGNSRRPEILKLFEDNVYGQMPKVYDREEFSVTQEPAAMNGRATLKQVTVTIWKDTSSVKIHLVMFIPNHIQKPVPVFLLINNRDAALADAARAVKSAFWPAEMVIDSGYAIAAFQVNDAAPDDKQNYWNGVLRLYPEQRTRNNGMKAIGAWAWAASRIMDYFEKDKDVDAKKVCLVGHSRGGKAALWAGAEDPRFAIVFSNCSGNSGAALSRRRFGETVKAINDQFPHWFCENYKKYNDHEDDLPVDQHMLIALIAPRPVYVTSASKDLWADPKGTFLALQNAQPVYTLYGKHVALPADLPPVNTPVIHSIEGYHIREGEHDLTSYDWGNFIQFANYHFFKASLTFGAILVPKISMDFMSN